jgi:predicted metal-dependent phosphotriesterase family hydrolase
VSFVRTVLRDVVADELGICYAHEHLIIDPSYATERFPHLLLDDVERAADELQWLHRLGVRALVDAMPCGAGRNVRKLATLAQRTGLHVIAPTGLHLSKYYPSWHWRHRLSPQRLADLFIADIEEGIDANDYSGPLVERTAHRAGLIKVASSEAQLDPADEALFEAAALAHRTTGAPVMTHTEHGRGEEQIRFFTDLGVTPSSLILSHTDRYVDAGYHRSLLEAGVRLAYDRFVRGPLDDSHPSLSLLTELLPQFPRQLMLATDGARPTYWRSHGGQPGLGHLLETVIPQLRARGLDEALVARLLRNNPAEAFAFREPARGRPDEIDSPG